MQQNDLNKEQPDHLFSEELTPPPTFSWEKMEGGIQRPHRKHKRRGGIYLLGCFGVLLFSIGIGALGFYNYPFGQKKQEVSSRVEVTETENDKSIFPTFSKKNNRPEEELPLLAQKSTPTPTAISRQQRQPHTLKKMPDNLAKKEIEIEQEFLGLRQKNKLATPQSIKNQQLSESQKIAELPILLPPLPISEKLPSFPKVAKVEQEQRKQRTTVWQLNFNSGFSIFNRVYHSNNATVNAAMQAASSRPFGYTFGGTFVGQTTKKFTFGMGLRFTEHKQLFRKTQNETRQVAVENAVTMVTVNTFTGEEIVARATRIDTETLERRVQKVNRIRLWEIPFSAGYALTKNNWQARIGGEIGLATTEFSGFVLDENLQIADATNPSFPGQMRMNFFYGGCAELNRRITTRISAGFAFRMLQYKNFAGHNELYQMSPSRIDFSVVFRYKL